MNAVNHIPQDTLEQALDHYDLGVVVRCTPVALGIENSNYFVQTLRDEQRRDYVLTILEQAPYAGDVYQTLMGALDQAGLPVAAPIADRHGVFYGQFMLGGGLAKPFLVQPRLAGEHVFNPTERHLASLGKFLARMHKAGTTQQIHLPPYPRDAAWLADKKQQIQRYIGYVDQLLMADAVEAVTALLEREDTQQLPQGAIHGDLFRDNVLFHLASLSGVLDFHHAASGYLIYDLAVTANDWCNDNSGHLNPSRLMALLQAYHAERTLLQEEIWLFPLFCLYAGLAFWQSRLWVQLPNNRQSRSKNPQEFRNIVAHHLQRPCYIDYRLLTQP